MILSNQEHSRHPGTLPFKMWLSTLKDWAAIWRTRTILYFVLLYSNISGKCQTPKSSVKIHPLLLLHTLSVPLTYCISFVINSWHHWDDCLFSLAGKLNNEITHVIPIFFLQLCNLAVSNWHPSSSSEFIRLSISREQFTGRHNKNNTIWYLLGLRGSWHRQSLRTQRGNWHRRQSWAKPLGHSNSKQVSRA